MGAQARASYKAPTRRPKEYAKSFTLKDPKGIDGDLTVLAEDYPAMMLFYRMTLAGILAGTSPTHDLSLQWTMQAIVDDVRLKKFEAEHPGCLTGKFKNVPKSFGRMLAKIGHCQVLTALDLDDFTPICLPYILGKKSNISYVVGGGAINDAPLIESGYFLRIVQISTGDRTLLVVEVRLIANNDTPTYHVVVGEVLGSENAERISTKIAAVFPAEIGPSFEVGSPESANYLWSPKTWPVKS